MERDLARYWPVFLLPTAAAFTIGFLIPFAMGLYLSFCDFTTLSNATFVGFGNYVRAFEVRGALRTRCGTRRCLPGCPRC